jgi:hypothetical protein
VETLIILSRRSSLITPYERAAKLTTSCLNYRKDERLFGSFVFAMKRFISAIALFLFFLFSSFISSSGQDLTGIWRGRFISESGDEYRLEFQIRQSGSLVVTGVSYSYLDVRFYGKTTMTGNFNKTDQVLGIQEIKTVELKMEAGSIACIMKYKLDYVRSGKEEFLEGSFTSAFEKTKPPFVKKGSDCGGGTVYLRKVPTSDFYVEPFLRPKDEGKKDSVIIKPKINPPVNKTPQKTNVPVKKTPNNQPGSRTNPVVPKKDTTQKITTEPVIKKPSNIPTVLKERENALAQVITVHTKDVTIKLYDNGEIDGDTISIYVDKQLVLSRQGLTAKPIIYPLHFDVEDSEHEVVMVAENLGRIPPNTSLMVITAGGKRYQVQITSTEQKNAMVRFRYEKPQTP